MKQFNLTGDPWIPVLRRDGRRSEVPLLELFERGGEIVDLAVPPADRIALMRLLLCIVMRSQPKLPESMADWLELTPELIAKHAAEYLRKWRDAFDLYGEHAFLQVNGLARQNNASQDKLDFTLASGNNHTLFDHDAAEDGRPHSDAWLARKLLVSQSFSTGGTIGQNTWNGIKTNDQTGNIGSPALEGSPLHVFCLGQNILDTLRLNLIPLAELGTIELGVPVWEDFPNNSNEAQRFGSTLLGRLAPISRAVKLDESSSHISFAVACNYAKLPKFIDPYLSNKKSKDKKEGEKIFYLGVHPDRHPWRELESLLTLAGPGSGVTPPKNLLVRKYLPRESILRLWCGGVAAKKANYTFTGEWTLSLPVWKISRSEFMQELFDFTKNAERIEGIIKTHIDLFWDTLSEIRKAGSSKNKDIRNESKKASLTSEQKKELDASRLREYWSRLNRAVPRFLSDEDGEPDFIPLYEELGKIAVDSFRENLPSTSPWHVMACGKVMHSFRLELGRIINPYLPKGEI